MRSKKEAIDLYNKLGFIPWDSGPMEDIDAQYKIIVSGRSDGKTYGAITIALKTYIAEGKTSIYLRRWEEDFKQGNAMKVVEGVNSDGSVPKLTAYAWEKIVYKEHKYFLAKWDEDLKKDILDNQPFMYSFALTRVEHDKGVFIPNLKHIIFDEFIPMRHIYLPDEFIIFMNAISTFVRYRGDVIIWMLSNTIDNDNPYFRELGLFNAKTQEQGTIDKYEYKDMRTIAMERLSDSDTIAKKWGLTPKKKASDRYFEGFENPKLAMITGGSWQIAMYPHLTGDMKYRPNEVRFRYYISWHGELYQCEIVKKNKNFFTFIHPWTSKINEQKELVYDPEQRMEHNYSTNILKPRNKRESVIRDFFMNDNVYYSDNVVGDAISHYLQFCKSGV